MVGISSVGDLGTPGLAILWFHHPSKLDLRDALLPQAPEKDAHGGEGPEGSRGQPWK